MTLYLVNTCSCEILSSNWYSFSLLAGPLQCSIIISPAFVPVFLFSPFPVGTNGHDPMQSMSQPFFCLPFLHLATHLDTKIHSSSKLHQDVFNCWHPAATEGRKIPPLYLGFQRPSGIREFTCSSKDTILALYSWASSLSSESLSFLLCKITA